VDLILGRIQFQKRFALLTVAQVTKGNPNPATRSAGARTAWRPQMTDSAHIPHTSGSAKIGFYW
jgi:hypothetical protein